jgi:hypothetical protein
MHKLRGHNDVEVLVVDLLFSGKAGRVLFSG